MPLRQSDINSAFDALQRDVIESMTTYDGVIKRALRMKKTTVDIEPDFASDPLPIDEKRQVVECAYCDTRYPKLQPSCDMCGAPL